MADPVPTLTFSGDVRVDPGLEDGHVLIGGREYDLSETGQKVRVVGPKDTRTCPICIRYIGRVFDRNDPRIQMFRESGAHPRCRHSLMPVGLPGLDREVSAPGLEHVENLRLAGDTVKLGRLYGKTRTEWLIERGVDPADLYRPDGTLWPLEDLIARGIVPKSAAEGVPALKGVI
jgi:hypothetical protein